LAFKLRLPIVGPDDDLDEESVSYEPTSLKHETDSEMLQRLDYLTGNFSFRYSQLHVFLRGLIDRLNPGEVETAEMEDSDSD
jgi:hypothetical protein